MRSIRLLPKDIAELNRLTGLPGEVFYDKSSNSLRVFDGSVAGGHELLRADASNLDGIISIAVSETPPAATASGSLWFNSATGGLFVYYKDGSSNQWMQPVIPVGVAGGGGGSSTLAGLSDVNISSIADGYVLKYNVGQGKWIPSADLTGSGGGSGTYTLPASTTTNLGGVIIPLVDTSGITNISGTIGLAIASTSQLGGVKIDGSTITLNGSSQLVATLPTATDTVLGGVKIDNSSITITNGTIAVPAVATIGQANGVATLGSDGKLTAGQIPSSLSGAIVFKGTWNANTNTPSLIDGVGTAGWEYAVSTGGTRNLGSGSITYSAGDFVIYNGTIWERIPTNTIASAGTLTGTTLASNVVTSSLTSVGTLDNLTVTNAIIGSITGNADTVTNGVYTSETYSDPTWITSLAASKVGLGNVTNESKSIMFSSPTFTGTVSGVTATHVGLGNVTNESKSTMFSSPTFTGTVSGVTATHVGLGNVTNESKSTMFTSPTFTGTMTSQQSTELFNAKTGAIGTVVHDFSTGAIWSHESMAANFTANFTNVPTTTNRTIVCTLMLLQGSTAYIPNAVQIDGVSQTINWQGGSVPTGGVNKKEIVSFTFIRSATGPTWFVLGSLTSYG